MIKKKHFWDTFDQHWSPLAKNLTEGASKWTPEVLKNEFFYGSLYQLTQQTNNDINNVHALQNSFLAEPWIEKLST